MKLIHILAAFAVLLCTVEAAATRKVTYYKPTYTTYTYSTYHPTTYVYTTSPTYYTYSYN